MKTNQFIYKTMGAVMTAAVLLLGSSSAFAQVKIGTNPTSIGASNNLEVEASTSGRKTSVDRVTGQVTIKDGTEGVNKILTSDANGGASWQNPYATSMIVGVDNQPPGLITLTAPNLSYVVDAPITLNKGVYELYYYADYQFPNPVVPSYIYFTFIVTSGTAIIPSYPYGANNDGPHVVPQQSANSVGARIAQMVVVTADNTVIKPRYQAPVSGGILYHGKIAAFKFL